MPIPTAASYQCSCTNSPHDFEELTIIKKSRYELIIFVVFKITYNFGQRASYIIS